jgi:hypothetical protein
LRDPPKTGLWVLGYEASRYRLVGFRV